jgi:hypothetical protein
MPTYRITGIFTGTTVLGVFEAATPEEAIELALDADTNDVSLCHHCNSRMELDDSMCHRAIADERPEGSW